MSKFVCVFKIRLLLFACLCLSISWSWAADVPDFSGVWRLVKRSPPTVVFGGDDPTPSAKGKKLLDAYRQRYDMQALGIEPLASCVTAGMPTLMFGIGGSLLEIIQQQDRIIVVSEMNNQIRRIRLDGQGHRQNYPRSRNGDSIGHWDDNTLTVETSLVEPWLLARWPHTENVKFAERFYLQDASKVELSGQQGNIESVTPDVLLVDEMTMIDADLYDEPIKLTMYYSRIPDHYFLEYNCSEGIFWEKVEAMIEKGH